MKHEDHDSLPPDLKRLAERYRKVNAPPGFTARVMGQVAGQGRPLWGRVPAWAIAAAVLLAVFVALPWRTLPPEAPPTASVRKTPDKEAVPASREERVRMATKPETKAPATTVADDSPMQTRVLADAAAWLAGTETDGLPALDELSEPSALPSIMEIPDPFS